MNKFPMEILKQLNDEGIIWGLGGSCLLSALGADVSPRDLDLVVKLSDIDRARACLEAIGAVLLEEKASDNTYLTRQFYTLMWRNKEIDLMADAGIQKNGLSFRLSFEEKGPWGSLDSEGETLYLSSPYDWITYYSMMAGREKRVSELMAICQLIDTQPEAFGHIKRAE